MIDWARIDTVFLDMDGTLLDLHFDNHFWREHMPRRYAEYHGLDEAVARERLIRHYERHAGTLNWYCIDFWTRELALDVMQLKEEVLHLIAVRPDVPAFLKALRDSGRRVVMVTNAHPRSLDLKMRETRLDAWFDALISSHGLGLPKEHPDFWQGLQTVEPFDRARTLFVDDSLPVLESARAYGIAHLLAVCNPDSRQPDKACGDFQAIASFAQVMPG
ncbi:MAG: haloacid dehalogenase [Comamonas sp. SCN 65-56]|uniref:GMP/IMP nucleotidase n=1 Tax=Comamonas sp. SCN 65-56 TaxID=1660095 RepID=UPI00086D0AF4|nr:GMP/IMP nucleotidase [Comamonas sp. SCN 65-56]MBN8759367.1 GMP/IMP nucleotidase [Thiobacillus sp.]ODS89357.1 MAG: haloacid dehalogenase [Comamonas sp. SCN 65-56]ODU90305.1 MAG: haloacid dehalogenase [Thiobacillus sp. SCN 65-179]OJW34811.1 MAG: haloacid dehalogenase [Thiobacillus sp. 65-69]